MALVGADYKFIFVDIGCQGRLSDGAVFKNSQLYKKTVNIGLNLPADDVLPDERSYDGVSLPSEIGSQKHMPCVIVADDAIPLKKNIMKPCSKRPIRREKDF